MEVIGLGIGLVFFILMICAICILPMILALISIVRSEFKEPNNKIIWLIIVIVFPLLGSILYFIIGRDQRIADKNY